MLIVLSESLRDHDLQAPLTDRARDALLNLSTVAYQRQHLVSGSRRMFKEIQQLAALGKPATDRFHEASALLTDADALRHKVLAYVHVKPAGQAPNVEVDTRAGANQIVFNVPLDYFADSGRTDRSWLIGENLRDTDTYVALGEAYAKRSPGFLCTLKKSDGHGGATAQAFALLARQDSWTLCLVDSDRCAPAADLGQTASDTIKSLADLRAQGKIAHAHVLPCRELENLLPTALVIDALPEASDHPDRIRVTAARARLGGLDFADVKDLVKLEQVRDYLVRLRPDQRASRYLAHNMHAGLEEVVGLVWSFGLGARRGRT